MALMTTTEMLMGIRDWVLGKIANITALIPLQASTSNQLADKAFVSSSVATATATFLGTYNVVTDLSLAYNATHSQIESALATKMTALSITPDNNDYAFVQIPTADATPTEIARIEKYKYNGTAWAFEYELNNSGFTAAQWAAINSGATLELMGKLSDLPTNTELVALLNSKAAKAENATAGHLATLDANGSLADSGINIKDNGAYDVSAHNGGIAFADLSALLSRNDLNTLIPTEVRHGGMSIKFVLSSDNKYVQVRCIADEFTTDITQWQENLDFVAKHPVYINAVIDANNKIIDATDSNGVRYFPAGISSPTIDNINNRINEIQTVGQHPAYVKALLDEQKRVVGGVLQNGVFSFPAGINSPTIDNINERISEIAREKGSRVTNYVIVAASNSTQNDKNIADYICMGQNDEDVINEALEHLPNGGTLQLMDGDYYIDNFPYSYTVNNVNYKCAIFLGFNEGNARTITLTGTTEKKGYNTQHGVNIHVTKNSTDNMDSNYSYTVISGTNIKPISEFSEEETYVIGDHVTYNNTVYKCIADVETPGAWTGSTNWAVSAYWNYTFINNANILKIYIFVYTLVGKKVVGIDCRNFGSSYIELVGVYTESYFDDRFLRRRPATPAYGSIGVITNRASNDEMARVGMRWVFIGGFHTGFLFAGVDHIIVMGCNPARCCVGYQFGASSTSQSMKVIVLINCADEGNTHLPRFRGYTGNILAYGFTIEPGGADNAPIDETGDTEPHATMENEYAWKGEIYYNTQGFTSGHYDPNKYYFWKKPETDGQGNITKIHGKYIHTVHINQPIAGNTDDIQNPDYLQRLFDEANNTWKTWNGKEWI